MNKILIYLLGVVGVLVILFFILNSYIYNEKQGDNNENGAPEVIIGENLEGEADPSRMTLDMKTWNWVGGLLNNGESIIFKKPEAFTLALKEGRFSAKTDCNSITGSYTASSGLITFSNMAMTKMYCEGSQESEFIKLLENSIGYHFTSRGQLIFDLKFDSGNFTFR